MAKRRKAENNQEPVQEDGFLVISHCGTNLPLPEGVVLVPGENRVPAASIRYMESMFFYQGLIERGLLKLCTQ